MKLMSMIILFPLLFALGWAIEAAVLKASAVMLGVPATWTQCFGASLLLTVVSISFGSLRR